MFDLGYRAEDQCRQMEMETEYILKLLILFSKTAQWGRLEDIDNIVVVGNFCLLALCSFFQYTPLIE